ncbi:MAG: NUDIX hydrolase [Candidatus Curtissbacteria bacterium]|nr:NUDIX hydrolase [Candidatus Curtissbacteria bacterium]
MIKCTFENGTPASLRHVVVDAIVVNKKKEILLVKRSKDKVTEGGKWALPGGFMDRDETLIEAVLRETKEETGWEIGDVELLRVVDNPKRRNEDRQNVAFFYTCVPVKKSGKADDESSEQRWFKLDGLPEEEETAFDHLEIIEFYLRNK